MAINRVDFGGKTLIDLTGDTLESAEQLLKGIIAHSKDGSVITGLMEAGGGGGNIVAGSFTPTSGVKTFKVNHNFNTVDICFVVFMSENNNYVDRGALYSSFIDGRKSWMVYNRNSYTYAVSIFGNASNPTITTESVDLTAFFYNSVFIGGSKYTYFVWKNGEV